MPTFVPPSGNDDIDALLWGWKWDSTTLSVAFPQSPFYYSGYAGIQNFQPFSSLQQGQIANYGLNNISVFSGLNFTGAANPANATLRYAQASQVDYGDGQGPHIPGGRGSAEGTPPDPTIFAPYAMGDQWFTIGEYTEPVLGSFQYAAGLLHETGHALGLKHGHVTQQADNGAGGIYDYPALPANHDSQEFSVMTYRSYIGGVISVTEQEEYPSTYMMLDVQALQYLYGANFGPGSNHLDTRYYWDENTGQMSIQEGAAGWFTFGVPYHNKILANMWDGGGNDTYVLTNHSQSQFIDMRPGGWLRFSDAQLSQLNFGQDGAPQFARGNVSNSLLYQGNPASLIENVQTGSGSDGVIGNQVANHIQTGGGDDVLIGGQGGDILDGGAGTDTASYITSAAGVVADMLNPGSNTGDAAGDTYISIESISGSAANDRLGGDNNDNEILGQAGHDTLFGYGGDDNLEGGAGRDVLYGGAGRDNLIGGDKGDFLFGNRGIDFIDPGAGADQIDGGGDFDRVWYGDSPTYVKVGLDSGAGKYGNAAGDTYTGIERITGSAFADVLIGNEVANAIKGGGGRDTISGLAGRDVMEGQAGNDTLYGGSGNDVVVGGDGNDKVYGNRGFDRVDGGLGNDELWGGNDVDYFRFVTEGNKGFGQDIIRDFDDGADRIDVRGVYSTGNPSHVADEFPDFTLGESYLGLKVKFERGQVIYLDTSDNHMTVADIDASDFVFA